MYTAPERMVLGSLELSVPATAVRSCIFGDATLQAEANQARGGQDDGVVVVFIELA